RLTLGEVAAALADAGPGLVFAAHRKLHPVDAARAPLDATGADRGVEQAIMLVGHGSLQIHMPHVDLDAESRLGNSCDPPGFREDCIVFLVMAGLVPAIHVFSAQKRRGCPAQGPRLSSTISASYSARERSSKSKRFSALSCACCGGAEVEPRLI